MSQAADCYSRVDMKNFGGHKDEVNCVAFSPDYEMMVTGSDDQRVRVFNAVTGNLICKLKGHTGELSFRLFASEDQACRFIEL